MASAPVAPLRSLKQLDLMKSEAASLLLQLLAAEDVRLAIGDVLAGHMQAFVIDDAIAIILPALVQADPDIDAVCDALDAADPLLGHIEAQLGLKLEPAGFSALADTAFGRDDAITISAQQGAQNVGLALCPDEAMLAQWRDRAAALPVNAAKVTIPVTLDCVAARLPVAEAAGIASGDLLLLSKMLPAMLTGGGGQNENGLLELNSGNWRAGAFADAEDEMIDDEDGQGSGGFTVPVTMRLPQQAVSAATLSALAPGMVIPLSPLVQGLGVDLLVGGRRIARGEIVELGENFAVHIDEAFSTPEPPIVQPANFAEEE